RLRLHWLELDGRPVAAEYHIAGEDIVYAYQSGIEPEVLHEEPGHLAAIATLQLAIAQGYRAFDFLRGDEPYKAHWRAQPRPPCRRLQNAWAASRGRSPATVFYYHRIADDGSGAWTYSTDLFARQIRWLKRHCDLISLEEVQERVRCGHGGRPAVSITFDDGY